MKPAVLISTQIQIPYSKFQGCTGTCYHRCTLLPGANKAAGRIGKLGIYSCRCKHCNIYYPITADYIRLQSDKKAKRCPCCNRLLSWRPKSKVRKTRVQEMEEIGLIKRI